MAVDTDDVAKVSARDPGSSYCLQTFCHYTLSNDATAVLGRRGKREAVFITASNRLPDHHHHHHLSIIYHPYDPSSIIYIHHHHHHYQSPHHA